MAPPTKHPRAAAAVLGLVASLACPALASTARAAELSSRFEVAMQVQTGGHVAVRERIELDGELAKARLTRNLWMLEAPGAWPLQQSVDRIAVVDGDSGRPLRHRVRRYGEHVNIDLLELAAVVELRYRYWRGSNLQRTLGRIDYTLAGVGWSAAIASARVRIEVDGVESIGRAGLSYTVGYSPDGSQTPAPERQGRAVTWSIAGPIDADEPVSVAIEHDRGDLRSPSSSDYRADLFQLAHVHAWIALAVLALALAMLVVPARAAIRLTSWLNFAPIAPAAIVAFRATTYWYFEGHYRASGDNLAGEGVINVGLIAFIVGYAWRQLRLLNGRTRAAYFAQLGVPATLFICLPLAFVSRDMLFFPLVGLPLYLHWWRPSIAMHFGVGSYRITEAVAAAGELAVAEVCRRFSLREAELVALIESQPSLSLVLDRDKGTILSAEVAALHKELRVCPHCGGATTTAAMASLECGYCQREYLSDKTSAPTRPVPVVVESIAMFVSGFAVAAAAFAVVIGLGILAMELAGGSLVGAVIGAGLAGLVLLIPAALLFKLNSKLLEGRLIGLCRLALLVLAPLVGLLIVAIKLGSRRVQLFRGKLEARAIDDELQRRGQWPLGELARYLGASSEEAAELALFLAATGQVDGVFERTSARLVSRALYRSVAANGSCEKCGGFYGVIGARVACHYCGHAPEEPPAR